jgi:hypothetical protein
MSMRDGPIISLFEARCGANCGIGDSGDNLFAKAAIDVPALKGGDSAVDESRLGRFVHGRSLSGYVDKEVEEAFGKRVTKYDDRARV